MCQSRFIHVSFDWSNILFGCCLCPLVWAEVNSVSLLTLMYAARFLQYRPQSIRCRLNIAADLEQCNGNTDTGGWSAHLGSRLMQTAVFETFAVTIICFHPNGNFSGTPNLCPDSCSSRFTTTSSPWATLFSGPL